MYRTSFRLVLFVFAVVTTRAALALVLPFGSDDYKRAGEGCVAGYTAEYAWNAYYRGDTTRLNQQLKALADKHASSATLIVRLHRSSHAVDAPEEEGRIDRLHVVQEKIPVDWSVLEAHAPYDVAKGQLQPHGAIVQQNARVTIPYRPVPDKTIIVDVWRSDSIDIDGLRIPDPYTVERFADSTKKHAQE